MKRLIIAILGVSMTAMFVVFSCMPVEDPELAPAGSSISLVGYGESDQIDYTCRGDFQIPAYCLGSFADRCVSYCMALAKNDPPTFPSTSLETEFNNCIKNASVDECAQYICGSGDGELGGWFSTCSDEAYAEQASTDLASSLGGCGYIYYLIDALVQGPATSTIVEGGEEVTNPLNNIEVRWTAMGGDLYLPADIPGDVPPLSNPFYDETGETGLSEVKWRIALPTACGESSFYRIGASIGTAAAAFQSQITVAEAEEEAEGTK